VTLLLKTLDQSLKVVPDGRCADFFLHLDGSVSSNSGPWKNRLISLIPLAQAYYEQAALSVIVEVFTQCVDRWIALKNEQKYQIRNVTVEEFSEHIKRICFVRHFILSFAEKFITHPLLKAKICAQLSRLIPETPIVFPDTARVISQEICFRQLNVQTLWKLQELAPPPLTAEILKTPAPQTEILELPVQQQNVLDLPTFYQATIEKIENPTGSWYLWLKDRWNKTHGKDQKSLIDMCKTISQGKAPRHKLAEQYIKQLLALFKSGHLSIETVKNNLDELVHASRQCEPEWATESEKQYRRLTGKEVTPRDKALQWKSHFIEQQLLTFFRSSPKNQTEKYHTETEDSHNANLMNTIYHHWGDRLGRQEKAPSVDIHVIKKASSLTYQWTDIFRFLEEKWTAHSVDAFLNYAEFNKWGAAIGLFLEKTVKEKLSSVQNPQEFVLNEYFDEKGLNRRGAIRFLHETLTSSV
jgi:hypothetical protein